MERVFSSVVFDVERRRILAMVSICRVANPTKTPVPRRQQPTDG